MLCCHPDLRPDLVLPLPDLALPLLDLALPLLCSVHPLLNWSHCWWAMALNRRRG
jgi:hypothetical protein